MGHKNRDARTAAENTAASNLAAAQQTAQANRVNQITPWGNVDYSQIGPNQWQVAQTLSPATQNLLNLSQGAQGSAISNLQGLLGQGIPSSQVNTQGMPELQGIDISKLPSLLNWDTSNFGPLQGIDLSQLPQLPSWDTSHFGSLLGIDTSKLPQLANWDTSGFSKLSDINLNALPSAPMAPGQTAQDAILSRLNPQIQRQRAQLQSELINQGFNPQDVGYNQGMLENNQQANDLLNQAAVYGINLDTQARQNALGEQQTAADVARQNQQQQLAALLGKTNYSLQGYNANLAGQQAASEAARQNYVQQLNELVGRTNYGLQGFNANLNAQQASSEAARQNQAQQLATLLGGANYSLQGYNAALDAQKAASAAALGNRGQMWNEGYQQTALNSSLPAQYAQLYGSLLGPLSGNVQSPGQYGVTSAQQQYPGGIDYLGALNVANQQRAANASQRAGLFGGLGSMIGTGAGLGALALML